MRFRFPWQRRQDEAKAETQKAQTDYEWTIQNRTTVNALVTRLVYHGEKNGLIEDIVSVVRGGHK